MDANNWFILETLEEDAHQELAPLKSGDRVRIRHELTGKYMSVFNETETTTNQLAKLVTVI